MDRDQALREIVNEVAEAVSRRRGGYYDSLSDSDIEVGAEEALLELERRGVVRFGR